MVIEMRGDTGVTITLLAACIACVFTVCALASCAIEDTKHNAFRHCIEITTDATGCSSMFMRPTKITRGVGQPTTLAGEQGNEK